MNKSLLGVYYNHYQQYIHHHQHAWTKYSFIHIDGTLGGLLKEEAAVGFSVLEALTPFPVGDLKFEEIAEIAHDSKSIFWGGIPGSYFTDCVSDEEFERHIKHVLSIMVTNPQFVPQMVAGHSLGEFSALVANKALQFTDALKLTH